MSLIAPIPRQIDISCADFFEQNSNLNNFYSKLFLMRCVFLEASSTKLNQLSPVSTFLYFKDGNLSSPLAALGKEIDICAHRLFWTKFNAEQLLLEAFLDVMRIFGGVELYILFIYRYCTFYSSTGT